MAESKSQEKRLAIQRDVTKSHTYELICEIVGLCLEMGVTHKVGFYKNEPYILVYFPDLLLEEYKIYDFTLNGDTTELDKAIIDLKTYKEKHNG